MHFSRRKPEDLKPAAGREATPKTHDYSLAEEYRRFEKQKPLLAVVAVRESISAKAGDDGHQQVSESIATQCSAHAALVCGRMDPTFPAPEEAIGFAGHLAEQQEVEPVPENLPAESLLVSRRSGSANRALSQ